VVFGLHSKITGVKCSNRVKSSEKWSKAAITVQILYWLASRPPEASAVVHRRSTALYSGVKEVLRKRQQNELE
jgi:hypothetical protein